MKDISNIIVLLFIFVFTYILIGMELFAYKIPSSYNQESSFDNFFKSFLTVFIVLCNEGWGEIYFDHYRSTEPISTTIYFISLLVVGQYILLNLFISSLIENFEQLSVRNDLTKKL